MLTHIKHPFPDFLLGKSILRHLLNSTQVDYTVAPLRLSDESIKSPPEAGNVHRLLIRRKIRQGVATATDTGIQILPVSGSGDVKPLKSRQGLFGKPVTVSPPSGWHMGKVEKEHRHGVPLSGSQVTRFFLVVRHLATVCEHRRSHRAINHVADCAFRLVNICVRREMLSRGRVSSAVGITGNSVPVIWSGPSKTAQGL